MRGAARPGVSVDSVAVPLAVDDVASDTEAEEVTRPLVIVLPLADPVSVCLVVTLPVEAAEVGPALQGAGRSALRDLISRCSVYWKIDDLLTRTIKSNFREMFRIPASDCCFVTG